MNKSKNECFSVVYLELYNTIYTFLKKKLSSEEAAKDLTQDVFMILWEKWDTLHMGNIVEYRKWLIGVTKNVLLRYYEKEKYSVSLDDEENGIVISYDSFEEDVLDENKNFDEFSVVEKAVSELKPDERELYKLFTESKMSYRELALRYKCSEASIGMKIYRIRRKIHKISKKYLKSAL